MLVNVRNLVTLLALSASSLMAQNLEHRETESPFAEFAEPDFPFISHTLDARYLEGDWPSDNLIPRGIVLDLGGGYHACFDPDLLRWALIWKANDDGEWLTMRAMSTGSYRLPDRKSPAGQDALPRPIGDPILAMANAPGFSLPGIEVEDRKHSVDPEELGLGPISTKLGRFSGIQIYDGLAAVQYQIGEDAVTDFVWLENGVIQRYIATADGAPYEGPATFAKPVGIDFHYPDQAPKTQRATRWPETVKTSVALGDSPTAIVRDSLPVPVPNPWKRNVRFSGFDFFSNGSAALSTFDGDVWKLSGIGSENGDLEWRRIASGLHEPLGLTIVDDVIYVADRNGIQRLHDTNDDGETDFVENFCNLIPQTAETREFAMGFVEKPRGGFYIAKGGQVGSSRGLYNGTICEITADGRSFEVIATGCRQPFIGIDPKTGTLTMSDQQGHWKPATPLRTVRPDEYYGFQPTRLGPDAVHPKTITDPEIWIPHFANQSGASQVWTRDAKLGPLNDSLIHLGYNRPEIFRAFFDPRPGARQGTIVSIMDGLETGLIHGRIHPIDGQLYVCGFKIWGTVGKDTSGLLRIRVQPDRPNPIPNQALSSNRGVLLTFAEPLSPETAENPANYTVDRWNYQRSASYGSGNYQLDGTPGQETVPVASARLSDDHQSVFIGLPGMQTSHSLRVTYRAALASMAEPPVQAAYFTVHSLLPLDLTEYGFSDDTVDLTPPAMTEKTERLPEPSIALGKEVSTQFGCIACHANGDALAVQPVGPSWVDLWGSKKHFTDGTLLKKVDAAYLRESIVDPGRLVSKGFESTETGVGMPSYLGVLKDWQIDSVVLYIESLKK